MIGTIGPLFLGGFLGGGWGRGGWCSNICKSFTLTFSCEFLENCQLSGVNGE